MPVIVDLIRNPGIRPLLILCVGGHFRLNPQQGRGAFRRRCPPPCGLLLYSALERTPALPLDIASSFPGCPTAYRHL